MGVLFQSGALWSSMTLAENVGLSLGRIHRFESGGNQRRSRRSSSP